jgi:uncharacterized protein
MTSLLTLALLLVAGLVVVSAATVWAMARMLLRPPRMTDGKALFILNRLTPADVGLDFQVVTFETVDQHRNALKIAGWWIGRAGADATAVVVHGYADAKVGALAWAPMWHDAGVNVLLIDLRAHGESGGRLTSAGFHERDDLDAVINSIRLERPDASRRLYLWGGSLGGAVALATAARREDIDGVVADGVFDRYPNVVANHARLIAAPATMLQPLTVRLAGWLADADFEQVAPVEMLAQINCPVLLVHTRQDPFVPPDEIENLARAMTRRSVEGDEHWILENEGHLRAIHHDPAGYAERIRLMLSRPTGR